MGLQPINEYVTQHEVYLRDYFNMSDDQKINSLPYDYPYFFEDFLDENGIDFKQLKHNYIDSDGEEQEGDDYVDYEVIENILQHNHKLFRQYGEYLYNRVNDHTLPVEDAEYPAWSYFSSATLIKNQWLIHFTKDAWGIAKNGFTRGVSEIEKLGLTTHLGEFDKKYGGYNFAFRANIYNRYATGRFGYKYGEEMVMFIGSGMEMHHYGDEEPQVIFWGKKANNIVPITKQDGEYTVSDVKSGRTIYKNEELDNVVTWIMRNYSQYQNKLHYQPTRTNKPNNFD